jgi:glutathione S-transferase
MKIIEQRSAPNPRRVRIFLAEKAIQVAVEQIDMLKLDHRLPAFTALNPMQQVPVLILDDGTAISESVAICRYFEELHPEPALFGTGPRGRALVEMANRRLEHGLYARVAQTFRHTHPAMAPMEQPQFKDWGEANRARIGDMLELLDRTLQVQEFIGGDRYSIADITGLVSIDFMRPIKMQRPAHLAALTRWYDQVSQRPSARA